MRRLCIGLAAVLAAGALCLQGAAPAGGATALGARTPPRADLPRIAKSLVTAGAPGALVYVRTATGFRGAANGFGILQPRTALRVNDRYRIASVTKPFVATVVLQLVSEGRLSLGDSVERWLPGLVPNGAAITIRQLLNHTSGLFDYTEDPAWSDTLIASPSRRWAPRELLPFALSHPPLFAPGTNWSYSNTNYVLLGFVIEAVSGKGVAEVLQERLFGPLALRSTTFPTDLESDGHFAHGYVGLLGPLIDSSILSPTFAYAAGEIVSNAADVTKFFAALLRGRLLPAAQLKAMKTGSAVTGTYGLGLMITSTRCGKAFGHDGDFPGWRNITLAKADGRRVAVAMVNIDTTHVTWDRLRAAAETALCSG
jgi:D-alanyl-D-alanine carboxypeptidase